MDNLMMILGALIVTLECYLICITLIGSKNIKCFTNIRDRILKKEKNFKNRYFNILRVSATGVLLSLFVIFGPAIVAARVSQNLIETSLGENLVKKHN